MTNHEREVALIKKILMYITAFLLASFVFAKVLSDLGGWIVILSIIYLVVSFIFRKISDPIKGKILCTIFSFIIALNFFPQVRSAKIFGIENAWVSMAVVGYIFLLGTSFYIKNFWRRIAFTILCLAPGLLVFRAIYLVALSIGPALGN